MTAKRAQKITAADVLNKVLAERKLRPEDVAAAAHLSYGTVRRLQRGEGSQRGTWALVAKALGMEIEDFLGE